MRKIIVNIIIVISIISCKEKPNYNPFDEQFDVSVNTLIRDNCDTISAGCGYFNLVKREGKLKPYYQVYMEDFSEVVAKGFSYEIDTFRIRNFKDIYTNEIKLDSIKNLPIDKEEFNKEFGKFGYKINSRVNSSIQIVNAQLMDTIDLELDAYPIYGNRYLARGIGYFKTENK